uniref:Putative splicing factor 3A subunit 1 n=3 Tax=Noccaea caerulescens TaxID=107243 RepID=A0A1J3FG29_NOCCA
MPSLTQNDLQSGDQSRQSEAPAGLSPVICFFIEKTALLVAQKGSEYEKSLMAEGNIHPDWSFLWSSDPYHGYYQQKISEARNQQPDDIKAPLRYWPKEAPKLTAMRPGYKPLKLEAMKLPESCHKDPRKHEYITYGEPQAPYLVKLPQGITRKELYTIKLTAQFVARHGMNFQSNLMIKKRDMDDSRFEFMNQTDCRFDYFNRLSAAYAKEMPPRNRNAPSACTATVLDGFFRLLERDSREELEEMESQKKGVVEYQEALEKETKGVEVALIDPPELVLLSQLGYPKRVMDRPPEEPEPKRHKPALVPEDQFLAQHQGSSTISVAVPNGQVIEITVHSLSENVASLKEKIAAEIQIPASKHKLSGTAGFLEDSMSLAHYNVGAGEILTLSL